MRSHFYDPLGADNLGYLPTQRLPGKRVVPTERDSLFRKTLTKGYVHDENASLFGGISGNAGLFSNAAGVYKMLQMWLQGGSVGGENTSLLKPLPLLPPCNTQKTTTDVV